MGKFARLNNRGWALFAVPLRVLARELAATIERKLMEDGIDINVDEVDRPGGNIMTTYGRGHRPQVGRSLLRLSMFTSCTPNTPLTYKPFTHMGVH